MFTLDQRKAHDYSRHISITANAGSGKTRVLVSRFCDILQYNSSMEVNEVAAITFTEKAAGELRERIAEELNHRESSQEHFAYKKRISTIRESLNNGIITTIHGFCSQMLREFPIETKAPPSFTIVMGYDRDQMIITAVQDAIEEALTNNDNQHYDRNFNMARLIGREKLEAVVFKIIGKREDVQFSKHYGILNDSKEFVLEKWNSSIKNFLLNAANSSTSQAAISELLQFAKDEVLNDVQTLQSRLQEDSSLENISESLAELHKALLTEKGEPRATAFNIKKSSADFEILQNPAKRLSNLLTPAYSFLKDADFSDELQENLYNYTQILLEIANNAEEKYSLKKRKINALDFDDLQLLLFNALSKTENKSRMTDRFKFVMVDEFQDTNELQYSTVYNLLNELSAGRLCVVGDRKQSIYGFRNADVSVFSKAENDIMKFNHSSNRQDYPLIHQSEQLHDSTQTERLGIVSLKASFRLLPGVCAFVNKTCSPILKPQGFFNFGVEYEPLVCARKSDGKGRVEFILNIKKTINNAALGGISKNNNTIQTNQTSNVTTANATTEDSNDGESEEIETNEAELIAKRILQMVIQKNSLETNSTEANNATEVDENIVWEFNKELGCEAPRRATFRDIAILCRKRSTFHGLELAFRKYGIPFVTNGSGGFYGLQEVFDLINYLRVIVNPRDSIALLGLLRSPFFAVSDSELYRVSKEKVPGDNDIWAKAISRATQNDSELALKRAVMVIADDIKIGTRLPVHLVIKRVIERTGWRGSVVGSQRGERILANIDKLIEQARNFSAQGFKSLYDFTVQATDMILQEEQEAEAETNTLRDAVKIMTIHASKGLEFPVVFIPSMESPPRKGDTILFDKELGWGFTWDFEGEDYVPAITKLISIKQHEKELAEEARLYYVAATRGKDMLVLCGSLEEDKKTGELKIKKKNTMLSWALAPFGFTPNFDCSMRLVSEKTKFLNEDLSTEREEVLIQNIDFKFTINNQEKFLANEKEVLPFNPAFMRVGELPAKVMSDIYSASQLLIYSQCPTKYYLKYRLGLPEDIAEIGTFKEITINNNNFPEKILLENNYLKSESDDGTKFARIFRQCAERIDFMQSAEDIEAIVEISMRAEPLVEAEFETMRIRLIQVFTKILNSVKAREVLFQSGSTVQINRELRTKFGLDFIVSIIDRTLTDGNGNISIVQYKTLQASKDEVPGLAQNYLPQLRVYAYMISLLSPKQQSINATIIFTEHPDQPQTFAFSKFELRRITEETENTIQDIRAISYSGKRGMPTVSSHCPNCGYFIEGKCVYSL